MKLSEDMDLQQDTRPYSDAEVPAVISRLLANTEFLDFLGRYHSPRLAKTLPRIVRLIVRRRLHGLMAGIQNIADFQRIVASYAQKILAETTTSFRHAGIEHLDKNQACLFVSNHRDIAGDSMLVDYALFESSYNTVRIAVGDNLVQKEFATDVMRLNKSFFIKRSEEGAKKVYAALLDSSNYIRQSLKEGESVWIAQAEGRAKSGMDLTDPALIKMFALSTRKDTLSETIQSLNIVPVSVSYEFDPCDVLKAGELHANLSEGGYVKPLGEDMVSLVKGLVGFKGHVRVRFGECLRGCFETPEQVAQEIDRQVLMNLSLFPVNLLALRELAKLNAGERFVAAWNNIAIEFASLADSAFDERLSSCPEQWRNQWLTIYANPVLNKLDHGIAISLDG